LSFHQEQRFLPPDLIFTMTHPARASGEEREPLISITTEGVLTRVIQVECLKAVSAVVPAVTNNNGNAGGITNNNNNGGGAPVVNNNGGTPAAPSGTTNTNNNGNSGGGTTNNNSMLHSCSRICL